MERIYVIVSENKFLIQKQIEKFVKNEKDAEIVHYDLKETNIEQVTLDLDTFNFFTKEKIIIAQNAYFLTGEKVKNEIEQNLEALEKYIDHPSMDNVLILTADSLDARKTLVKELKKKAKVIEAELDVFQALETNLEDYEMDFPTKQYLLDRTMRNPERTLNELEKLKLYKLEEKRITREDIDEIVSKTVDDNIFNLIDAILQKKKKTSFEIYEDMLLHGEEPMKILILLANRIRLLYQVKKLSKTIYRDEEIGKIIGSHPYPVKLARGMISKYSEKELIHCLKTLANMDIDIKTGKTYQNIALEMFMLTL